VGWPSSTFVRIIISYFCYQYHLPLTLPITLGRVHYISYLIFNVLTTMFDLWNWSCLVSLWNRCELYLNSLPVWPRSYAIECARNLWTVVGTVTILARFPVGLIWNQAIGWFTFPMIASPSYHNFPDWISISTHIDPCIRVRKHDTTCTSPTEWLDPAGTNCSISEHKQLNAIDCIEAILASILKKHLWKLIVGDGLMFLHRGIFSRLKLPHTEEI